MKPVLKTIIALLLLYAFFMTLANTLFSVLSLSPETQMDVFISEKVFPDVISLFAIGYCLYRLFLKSRKIRFSCLTFFLCMCSHSYGQNYVNVNVKGLYFRSFHKNEIAELYENNKKKAFGLDFSVAIDYSTVSFFIPLQIGEYKFDYANIRDEETAILAGRNDTIFIIPSSKDVGFLKEMNIIASKTLGESIISDAMQLSPYYVVDSNNDKLYRCVYIEGIFRCFDIHNIEEKWQSYILGMYTPNTKVKNQIFFVLDDIVTYTPYIEDKRFEKWLPYMK